MGVSPLETLYSQIVDVCDDLRKNHEKHIDGTAAAGARARKNIGALKALMTPYRKASVELDDVRKEAKKA